MDTLEKIHQSGIAPGEFWYVASLTLLGLLVVFMGVLIFFVKESFTDFKGTLKSLSDNLVKLTEMVTIHEVEITRAQDDIKNLEKRPRR